MRKDIIGIAVGALLLTGCAEKNSGSSCVINGEVDGWHGADSVVICEFTSMSMNAEDTSAIEDGKFHVEVNVEGQGRFMHILPIANGEPLTAYSVIVCPGKEITMKISQSEPTIASFEGDKDNEAWSKVLRETLAFETEREGYYETLRNEGSSDAEREEARGKLEESDVKMAEMYKGYIVNNAPSYFSDFLLGETEQYMSDSLKTVVLDALEKAGGTQYPQYVRIRSKMLLETMTAVGKKFIDFTQTDAEGNQVRLGDVVKGNKLTLVDFWASWCGPCRAEMPTVVEAYSRYHAKGLEIVGVSLDDNREAWLKSVEDLGMKWIQVSDLQGWRNAAGQAYVVEAIPSCYLIDQEGVIVAKNLRGEELTDKIGEILK